MYLASQFWSKEDQIKVLDHLTFEAVQDFVKQLMSFGIFVEALVHGNLVTILYTRVSLSVRTGNEVHRYRYKGGSSYLYMYG